MVQIQEVVEDEKDGETNKTSSSTSAAQDKADPHEKAEACRKAGNELLAKGDFADACKQYDEGLLALVVKNEERTRELRLALHLNAALAHLRRSNLASAVEHASGALAVDPRSVKGLYRRALARIQLAEHRGHDSEVSLAKADLEEALRLEPGNAEVRGHLQRLRSAARAEEKELKKSQRENFKGIFDSGKALYEDAPTDGPAAVLHTDPQAEEREVVLSVRNLHFHYERNEPVLQGIDLQLRAGWCVGLFGNNATGKTTLARLLVGAQSPAKGSIHHGGSGADSSPGTTSSWLTSRTAIVSAVLVAMVTTALLQSREVLGGWVTQQLVALAGCLIWVLAVPLKMGLDWWRGRGRERHSILHVTSESCDKEDIPGRRTIESVIGEKLPSSFTKEQRREKVIAMLCAGNFQMYNQTTGEPVGSPAEYVQDGLQYGNLSGGQRHLIYVLRCLAANPKVLVCDEVLGGLDSWRQPRVLHMLRRLKDEGNTAILYIGTELHQLRLMCDSVGFITDGRICELGPAEEVFEFPKHPATKDYVQQYRGLPGGRVLGGKLAESYTALEGDKDLLGPWLPW